MAATSNSDTQMVPAQIDYYLRKVSAPKYKMVKVPMSNIQGSSVSVGATDSVPIEFKLPANKVYNLSRSYLSYQKAIPGTALKAQWFWSDMFDMASALTFGAAGGNDLVNLQYLQNYTKINRKLNTPADVFMTSGALEGLCRSNDQASANYVPGGSGAGYIAAANYMEAQYAKVSAIAGANTDYKQYPLGAFHGTLLGVDRDFYSPVEMYLRLTVGTGNKIAYTSTSVTDPSANVAVITDPVTFSNIYLYLAEEQNLDIIASTMKSYASGQLKYSIPFTTGFKLVGSTTANSQTNISLSLTRQYGKRLKRITTSVFNPTESLNTAYDHDNTNGKKLLTYRTWLDNTPLQDRDLSCKVSDPATGVGYEDYAENKKFIGRQSSIFGRFQYQTNWFHMDQFFEPHDVQEGSLPEVNLDEGVLMDSDKQWLFTCASVNASQIHYTWAEFTREILITPDGAHFI